MDPVATFTFRYSEITGGAWWSYIQNWKRINGLVPDLPTKNDNNKYTFTMEPIDPQSNNMNAKWFVRMYQVILPEEKPLDGMPGYQTYQDAIDRLRTMCNVYLQRSQNETLSDGVREFNSKRYREGLHFISSLEVKRFQAGR